MSNRLEISFSELPQQIQDFYNKGTNKVIRVFRYDLAERYSGNAYQKFKVYVDVDPHKFALGEYWHKEGDVWHYEVFYS